MLVNLTVILGAGAAFDVVNFAGNRQIDDSNFRPPITSSLFDTHKDWENEYSKFSNVASVVEELRNNFQNSNHTSLDIENFLKDLKESSKLHRNEQFREFPLYLQHYFTHVSKRYCKKPTNYLTLLNKIFDLDIGKVVFITTNYDLLFDKALEFHGSTKYSISNPDMNKYIANENWAYIKIHGSVDWGRRIKEDMIKNKSSTLPGLLDNVQQLGASLEEALENKIIRDKGFDQDTKDLVYPAISVPISENKLNCPDDHIQVLKEHFNKCQNFLIIGFSGYDKDILSLLDQKEGGFNKVMFVSGSEKGASEARQKFMEFGELGDKLNGHAFTYDGNGFDEFVRSSNGLDDYLNKYL